MTTIDPKKVLKEGDEEKKKAEQAKKEQEEKEKAEQAKEEEKAQQDKKEADQAKEEKACLNIKGNTSSSGEKIYHVPGGQFYDKTNAEQTFCTEGEAKSAGYRESIR
ncbi:sunset domain-containing protein [Peribacillus butanolivorans]|uniref:sunset domain-containing protein n=1 Tax=Peribacillus butanolivorans TaxID=421767 RepID=UPI00366CF78A